MLSTLVIWYLFLGGAGAGSLIILSGLELFALYRKHQTAACQGGQSPTIPSGVLRTCWPITFTVLLFAVLCLIFDLGRVDRLLSIFLYPTNSAIVLGAFSLAVALACAAVFTVEKLFDFRGFPSWVTILSAAVGIVAGIVATLYTGILLGDMPSVVLWQNPLLPLIFFVSSLSTGIACVFIGIVFSTMRESPLRLVIVLARIDVVAIVLEAILITCYLVISYGEPSAQSAIDALLTGELAWLFWGVMVACGLIIPLMLEWYLSVKNYRMQILWIASLVLIGGFALRLCLVEASMFDVTQSMELSVLSGLTAV